MSRHNDIKVFLTRVTSTKKREKKKNKKKREKEGESVIIIKIIFKTIEYSVPKRVTRFLAIRLIVSAIKMVKSFRVERDFACLCENGFPSMISEIVFYEENPLCVRRRSEKTRTTENLYKENTSINNKLHAQNIYISRLVFCR